VTCVSCAQELPEGAVFCPSCGTRQGTATCSSCSSELTAGAAFCFRCGAPVAGQPGAAAGSRAAERRVTSILFADLVSYTTLSEVRDHEDVRELLTSYFDVCSTVVRRYGGTVEKFIGDAVMAVWGVPTAHEDDAERAVRAATELVTSVSELGQSLGIPELQLRAGVVTGEVAVTLGATDQGMVAGDPVNTAARVQGAAGPGEVWVDSATRGLTAGGVTYLDVGLHVLKGKAEPMQLFRAGTIVAAVGGSQRVDGLEAPLAGRDRELRLVKEFFHATVESGRPRIVVLDGEAGIGKTRLAWEFEKYVSGIESATYWHRGRCLSYGDGVAYWALAEAVRTRLGLVDETSTDEELDTLLAQWVRDTAERDWIRPRLATLIGGELREFEREDLFAAWTRFFERLGDDSESVTLVIDDAQFADDGLLAFLEHLLANARTAVFVLLLTRPELLDDHPQLGGRRSARVPLEPLTDTAMDTLVAGLVEGLPDQARTALVSRAEGVPLFAVETVRALIDRDLVRPEGGRYVVSPGVSLDLNEIAAPASLHALVAARLDALTPDERRVVADASVLGATFTQQGIAVLCGDVPDLDGVLASLQRKEIIGTDNDRFSAERGQFRFMQAVVRQVAYATLSRRDRKQRHLAVAGHLEDLIESQPEITLMVARHLMDAVEASTPEDQDVVGLNERGSLLLMKAAERSARLGAPGDALRLFEEAASRMPDSIHRAEALMGGAVAASAFGRHGEAIRLSTEAAEVYESQGAVAEAATARIRTARGHMVAGDIQDGITTARSAWDVLRGLPGQDAAQAQVATLLSRLLNRLGAEPVEQAVLMAEALRRAEASGDPTTMVMALNNFAITHSVSGSMIVSRAITREVAEISRAHEQWQPLISSLTNLALLERIDDLIESLSLLDQALRVCVEHGHAASPIWTNLATTLWSAGQWDEHARINAEAADDLSRLPRGDHIILYAADLWRRENGLARSFNDKPEEVSDDPNWLLWDAHVKALDAAEAGRVDEARAHALQSLDFALEDAGMTDDYIMTAPRMAHALLRLGDIEVARRLVDQVETRPRALPGDVLRAHERAFRGIVLLREGDDDEAAEAELRAGIGQLKTCGAIPDAALAQEYLGDWLVANAREEEGRSLLTAVRSTFADLGAVRWLARVDALLGVGLVETS
jgi:class 3 adenylate cyclase/tetratricopeptide (TPR) repeat protein